VALGDQSCGENIDVKNCGSQKLIANQAAAFAGVAAILVAWRVMAAIKNNPLVLTSGRLICAKEELQSSHTRIVATGSVFGRPYELQR